MKSSENVPLFAEERRDRIVKILEENSKILVPELCDHFEVSPATIRKDLRDLEGKGRLKRTHGGAIPLRQASFEPNSHLKEAENIEEKHRIAVCAAGFIENGDTIALDTGTTTLELAKCLTAKKDLTVMTNDLKIASFLENNSDANIILVGGVLRRNFHCTTGPMTVSSMTAFNVDKAFMASNAFSLEKGFTTPGIDQAEVKKAMISTASQIFVLLDSSKLGRISFIKFADINDIDKLITDTNIGRKTVQAIEDMSDDLELIIV